MYLEDPYTIDEATKSARSEKRRKLESETVS